MLLSVLAREAASQVLEIRGDAEIGSLSMDSRKKTDRGLYFCVPGARFDGHKFAPQAMENGAVALVVTHFLEELPTVPQVAVRNVRAALRGR